MEPSHRASELSGDNIRIQAKRVVRLCFGALPAEILRIKKKPELISRRNMKRIFRAITFCLLTISLASAQRLPEGARPENYKLTFTPDLGKGTFEGDEVIAIRLPKPTSEITL